MALVPDWKEKDGVPTLLLLVSLLNRLADPTLKENVDADPEPNELKFAVSDFWPKEKRGADSVFVSVLDFAGCSDFSSLLVKEKVGLASVFEETRVEMEGVDLEVLSLSDPLSVTVPYFCSILAKCFS